MAPSRVGRAEIRRWALAAAVALVTYVSWHGYGPQLLVRWGLQPSAALLAVFSLGSVTLGPFPPQPDFGWVCRMPWYFELSSGEEYLPVIPLEHAARYLLPVVTFCACLPLPGEGSRRRPRVWLAGIALGIGWYLTGILAEQVHVVTMALSRRHSPFFPNFDGLIPPETIVTNLWLGDLFYPSGLLAKLMATLSYFAGPAMWAWAREMPSSG